MIQIPEKYFELFEQAGYVKQVPTGALVYMENDRSTMFYILKSGRLRVYITSPKGKEVTLALLKRGSVLGDNAFLVNASHKVSIQAVTEAEVIVCAIQDVLQLLHENIEVMTLVLQHLTDTTDTLTHQIHALTMYDARERLADFLVSTYLSGTKRLTYSHDNVATCLNMNRVTVTRILKEFEQNRWIEQEYGVIHIRDVEALRKVCEGK